MHRYKVVRVHTSAPCSKSNNWHMEKPSRSDIMIYHYVKNIYHPHTIDNIIKSGLMNTGASGTHTRPDNPHEN